MAILPYNDSVTVAFHGSVPSHLVALVFRACQTITYYWRKSMNHLLQQSHRIFVALALAAILVVQAAPILSSFQIRDGGGWIVPLTECGGDTCG